MFSKRLITDKKIQKHSKIHFEEYLQSVGEPRDDISGDSAITLEANVIVNKYRVKRQFRQLAQKLRAAHKF